VLPKQPNRPDMSDALNAQAHPAGSGVPMAIDARSIATPAK
jgi:hypothetical protein